MSPRLKIAVWHNLPSGGAKRVLHYHVAGLVKRGHQVEAWCPVSADASYLPLGELVKEHVLPLAGWRPGPLGQWEQRRHLLDRGAARIQAMKAHSQQCADEIARGGFDLLFANTCREFASPYIGRYVRSPKLLYLQEPDRYLYEALPELPWLALPDSDLPWWHPRRLKRRAVDFVHTGLRRRYAREEVTNARAFDTILVNSFFSRESVSRAYGLNSRVCYLGVDTRLFRPQGLDRQPFVVGLGSFNHNKGIETAVEAMACLPVPRPSLVWIANSLNPPYVEEIEQLARARGVDLQIRPLLPDAELVQVLNEAAVMLYVSRLEPFGLAPLEANACGTPVVAVAEGGIRETIRAGVNGVLVDRDPTRLAEALSRLLNDPTGARELGERAVAYVREKWSVEQSVDRLESELERAVHEYHEVHGSSAP